MGKKLDAILGRGFKATKFKGTVNLGISRVAVLKNQHQARYSLARSDVVQILKLGHHERALLRVEQVIKEQNMLDVLVMIENYSYLLIERVNLLEQAKECPEELKEAVSSMIYAATRCGEFPELQELRAVFTLRFGKEFVIRAVELRNNCGVNPKMIQKLSTRMPSMENRVKMLKDIAQENAIVLLLEEVDSEHTQVEIVAEKEEDNTKANSPRDLKPVGDEDVGMTEGLSDLVKTKKKYKDVADAAQAAFESAAFAAEAARAAVELSRSDSHDSSDPRNPGLRSRKVPASPKQTKESPLSASAVQNYYSSESDEETVDRNHPDEFKQIEKETEHNRSLSASSLDSEDHDILNDTKPPSDEERQGREQGMGTTLDETDDDTTEKFSFSVSNVKNHSTNTIHTSELFSTPEARNVAGEEATKLNDLEDEQFSLESRAGSSTIPWSKDSKAHPDRKPVSVRTRRTYRR